MRTLYSFVWWLILPFALVRLFWRGKKEPGYRKHVAERLGFYPQSRIAAGCIWIHAVSVGETRAAEPLVSALLAAYPGKSILLTAMTPAGREAGAVLFGDNAQIMQAYLPYDTPYMMKRLVRHFSPGLCILMETEIWPNLIAQCRAAQVPVALVNARLSERSLARGERFSSLFREAAGGISCVAAQTETDAARLKQFGSTSAVVAGSVKFDVAPPDEAINKGLRLRGLIGERPVLMCASTRDGEEMLVLDALAGLTPPSTLVIIVPRHPQRFDEVAQYISSGKWKFVRRSELGADFESAHLITPETRILLGDSMGEMFAYYAACDVAFIGGSLKPLGGQNLIEACALGKPVIIGPHTFNFETITQDAVARNAAIRISSATELFEKAGELLGNGQLREYRGNAAREFAEEQRGATQKTLDMLRPFLSG